MLDDLDHLKVLFADRYTIEREIGRGGMATVYLAEELHPRRKVAIKVLSPDIGTRVLRDRFLREIDLASKLVHPHIVPVFAAGEVGGLLYYVMPHIDGESLRQRLTRQRVFPYEEATEIAREVLGALQYAHDMGIIHRDIKPENILFSRGHAMVADFGIARAFGAASSQLTQTGHPIGTPAYMSPEQWTGSGEIDGRTDVYSLGLVLLEMLGRSPQGATPAERLQNVAETLRASGGSPKVRRGLADILERALAIQADDRFASAGSFAEALRDLERGVGVVGFRAVRRRLVGLGALAGIALVIIALVAGLFLPDESAAGAPRRVVVSVFENQTGDSALAPLGAMAADWITQGLAQTGLVEVVGLRTTLASTQAGGPEARSATERIQALAQETGAEIVVWGAYYRQDTIIQFHTSITDAREGHLLRGLDPVAALAEDPLAAVEELRQRVMGVLATLMDERLSSWASASSQPPSFEAYELYVEGMALFLQLNQAAAIPRFYRAAALDSTFVAPLLMAAFAHATVYQWAEADSLGQIVNMARDRLARLDRHILDWVLANVAGDTQRSLEAIRSAAEVAPGSEALMLHGVSALGANRPAEALDAMERLDPERGLARGFFLYWTYVASSLHLLGRYEEELEAARRGRRQYPENPSMLLLEARALLVLGRVEEVDSVFAVLASLPQHPFWIPGEVMHSGALEARAHGDEEAASAILDRSLEWYRARPPADTTTESHRYGYARTLYWAGSFTEAEAIFQRLRQEVPDSIAYHGYLGSIAAKVGDRERALEISESLSALERPYLFGHIAYWQARIAALLAEPERAMTLLRLAMAQGHQFDPGTHFDSDLQAMRDYPPFQEWLRPKG
jgi:tetratricopeptide (TPR) repeat protein/tRNA A-37 threonylcarbamoyl transferase component Bud32